MGNIGSAHNLHNEGVESEVNPYCKQQHLRRMACDTRNKGYQSVVEPWSSGINTTTNGAILQAEGTISFHSKEQSGERLGLRILENELNIKLQPMRRCHTLILDGQRESLSQRKTDSPLAHFQRSQTLIHVGYNRTKSQDNIAANSKFQDELKRRISQTSQNKNTQLTTPKINKYNKKRKAPPAPNKALLDLDTNSKGKNLSAEPKNSTQSKPRIYTTNASKASASQQSQPIRHRVSSPTNFNIKPLQRCSYIRKSVNSLRPDLNSNKTYANSTLLYRREKSFDTVLLRHNVGKEHSIERKSMPNTNVNKENPTLYAANNIKHVNNRIIVDGSIEEKLTKKHSLNDIANTALKSQSTEYGNELNSAKEETNLPERKSNLHDMHISINLESVAEKINHTNKMKIESLTPEKKAKSQQTRIPQLKRTFYFGMKVSNQRAHPNDSKNRILENDDISFLNHKIEPEEEINDNGILVHVRPTLPRRQPETPSFSPAAAWRNLLEDQQLLQYDRSKRKQIKSNNHVTESPIYRVPNPKNNFTSVCNWTPQQDLEDDNEDDDTNEIRDNIVEEENKLGYKRKTSNILNKLDQKFQKRHSISPLHTFSLSLPRDVHLQCQMKACVKETEKENNTKTANYWLVPSFNSLQKFKTSLSKNIDSRPQSKCICNSKATNKRNSYNLQTVFGEPFLTDDTAHQSNCPLYRPNNFHNDNWVLHKSNLNVSTLAAITKTADINDLKSSSVYLQSKSLKSICGGKHIVYLPGQESINNTPYTEVQKIAQQRSTSNKSAYKRQRQEMVRESLQDITPIQNIHQSNVSIPEKNIHRFSFQSTVRILEKRRLAEKLSKDAEIQEAQRLHELEAMKRVEEDFRRKRAPEKANLRNQLRLHLKAGAENEKYRSLPLDLNDRFENHQQLQQQKVSDMNNNIFCRAEPDGAVSPPLDFNDNL